MNALAERAARFLEGAMPAEEAAAFEQELATNPALAQALARQARLEARLRRILGAEREQNLAADATPHTVTVPGIPMPGAAMRPSGERSQTKGPRRPGQSGRRRSARRSRPRTTAMLPLGLAALFLAALALGALVLNHAGTPRPSGNEPAAPRQLATPDPAPSTNPEPSPAHSFIVIKAGDATTNAAAALTAGAALQPGDTLVTGQQPSVCQSADGSTVTLAPGTTLTLSALHPATALKLERGLASYVVSPQKAAPFTVAMPLADISVIGTRFVLEAGPYHSWARVEEGRVRFASNTETRVLGAGDEGLATADAQPRIFGFSLVDAISGTPLPGRHALRDGDSIDQTQQVAIVARTSPSVSAMRVSLDQQDDSWERNPPFALLGNPATTQADTASFYPVKLSPGSHRFVVTPYDNDGAAGPERTLRVTIQ
ncbi:MAG: FecR family protein [Planctomycetota bacterium]|jgi:ferric-dicitrate binding protein FerR (iron transport regulator)|nr:FecR family protein [Planctomycetota bacterium]